MNREQVKFIVLSIIILSCVAGPLFLFCNVAGDEFSHICESAMELAIFVVISLFVGCIILRKTHKDNISEIDVDPWTPEKGDRRSKPRKAKIND